MTWQKIFQFWKIWNIDLNMWSLMKQVQDKKHFLVNGNQTKIFSSLTYIIFEGSTYNLQKTE